MIYTLGNSDELDVAKKLNEVIEYLPYMFGSSVGEIMAYAGNGDLPENYLLCDGSAILKESYEVLYEVIGTTYGTGDDDTTFNLPNITSRFLCGNTSSGDYWSHGLPNHRHTLNISHAANHYNYLNVSLVTHTVCNTGIYNLGYPTNGIYGNASVVQPKALLMRYIIRYI